MQPKVTHEHAGSIVSMKCDVNFIAYYRKEDRTQNTMPKQIANYQSLCLNLTRSTNQDNKQTQSDLSGDAGMFLEGQADCLD